jgi:esterase/lipase
MENYRLDEPKTRTSRACLFLPGISGGALTEKYLPLATLLNKADIALLRLEPWDTKDALESLTLNEIGRTIESAVDLLRKKGYEHIYGIGKSFGGAVLLYTNPSLFKKIVLWAPAVHIAETSSLASKGDMPLGNIESIFDINPRKEDLHSCPPVLIIYGNKDSTVPVEYMNDLVTALPYASLVTIPDMAHSPATDTETNKLYRTTIDYIESRT